MWTITSAAVDSRRTWELSSDNSKTDPPCSLARDMLELNKESTERMCLAEENSQKLDHGNSERRSASIDPELASGAEQKATGQRAEFLNPQAQGQVV